MNMKGLISISTILIWLASGVASDASAQKIAEYSGTEGDPIVEVNTNGSDKTENDLIHTAGTVRCQFIPSEPALLLQQ